MYDYPRQEYIVAWLKGGHILKNQRVDKNMGATNGPCMATARFSILAACRQPIALPDGLVAHGTVVS